MKNKKKRTGAVITVIVILLILATGAVFAWTQYTQIQQEKEAAYNLASEFFEAGNYRDAYKAYLQLEDYKDAGEKAEQTHQLMTDAAKTHMETAQHLSDLQFNTVAGLYLTEVLADENLFTLDDYNKMAEMIGNIYSLAQTQYQEVMVIDDKDKMTLPVMEQLMPRIEALEQHKDPQEALLVLSEITTFSLADQVFDHCWVDGIFVNTSLDTLAAGCPLWVPAMDQIIANDEGLDVIALVNRS